MNGNHEHLAVLILTDTTYTGNFLEHAIGKLGHSRDCNLYKSVSDIRSAIATRVWDLVVIEGREGIQDIKISSIDSSLIKLRLLSEDARAAIIAAGRPGAPISREAEWLVGTLSTLWRQVS